MSVWDWIHRELDALHEAGEDRLAELVDAVPTAVNDNRHDAAEAMVREGVARAAQLGRPWLEVYFKHWDLQSRILHRHHGKIALSDAVSLVELAHRPEARGCPQAICAVQDLSACYGRTDGPGYYEERVAVLRETLARIEPRVECYQCLGGELIEASNDAGRYEEALATATELEARRIASGQGARRPFDRSVALLFLGRLEEAWAAHLADEPFAGSDLSARLHRRVHGACILAELGRVEEAKASLPRYAEIVDAGACQRPWVHAVHALARRGAIENRWELEPQLQALIRQRVEVGALHEAVLLAGQAAELAVLRGAPHVAALSLRFLERTRAELRTPERTATLAARARAAIAAAPPMEPGDEDPERALAGVAPDDVVERARLLATLGHHGLAIEELEASIAAQGLDEPRARLLGHLLRAERDPGRFYAFVARLEAAGGLESLAAFLRALRARQDGDDDEARRRFERVVELDPDAVNSRAILVEMDLLSGRYVEALARLDALAAREAPPPITHFDRMAAAACVGDWARLRASAAALGIELPGESGPVEAPGGWCRVQPRDRGPRLLLRRMSPATGLVETVTAEGRQRFRDLVAFRPVLLDDAGDPPLPCYAELRALREGDHVAWELDGVHPGEAALAALDAAATAAGLELRVRSSPEYRVGDELPGLCAWLLAPRSAPAEGLLALIDAALGEAELCAPALARASRDPDRIARANALVSRLGLDDAGAD